MKIKYIVQLVRFIPTGNGTDVYPELLEEYLLTLPEMLNLFMNFLARYDDARPNPDSSHFDSILFTDDNGDERDLFIAEVIKIEEKNV